jgi:hypothetical protein
MASITNEQREAYLRALSLRAAHAETTDPREIFPVPEHLRALEPEVVLVIGDRGAGKTLLCKALVDSDVRVALARHARGVRVPSGEVQWAFGWPLGRDGPDPRGWRELLQDVAKTDDLVAVWLAYLLRAMRPHLTDREAAETAAVHDARAVDARMVLAAYQQVGVGATAALDALDERLARNDQWLYVAYDELDTLVLEDWNAMSSAIRALVSFWAAYSRRWRRLRPKLFMRSDFYQHHRDVAGADVAKLAGNRVELRWSDANLYGALIKHVINKRDSGGERSLAGFFARSVRTTDDPVLGDIPSLGKAADAKPFVDRLVSEYMGANKGKGLSLRWILDHLRDGNGRAVPRSLVLLIELAADIELRHTRAAGAHLLHHVAVRNALDQVSTEYVRQAETHELRWLDGLQRRLQPRREVPWRRRELLKLLGHDFSGQWSVSGARPPGDDAEEVLDGLLELGVLRARNNDEFDVPDLYLHGLDLRRKGGVAKK